MAAPADRQFPRELRRKTLRRKVVPFGSFPFVIENRRTPIEVAERLDGLSAIHASLPCVPVRSDCPDAVVLRITFDLLQTRLVAVGPFRPARTVAQLMFLPAN